MRDDDHLAILRAQKGDALAFARLHDSYYRAIYGYYFYRVDDPNTAVQLTSELFIRMVSRIGFYKPDSQKFLLWLYSLARSVLMEDRLLRGEALRRREVRLRRNPMTLPDLSEEELNLPKGILSSADSLRQALQALSPDEREVLIGRLVENRPLRQIAREIGRTVAAARVLQMIVLQKLHQMKTTQEVL